MAQPYPKRQLPCSHDRRKARNPERATSGCRSEVNLRSFSLFLAVTTIFLFGTTAGAQKRSSVPTAVLMDIIGGSVESKIATRPTAISRTQSKISAGSAESLERRTFEMLNEARAANGLEPLLWDDDVAELARTHSIDMARNKYFAHRDLDGLTVDGRAESFGLSGWNGIGENIAMMQGQKDPAATAIENWLKSPGHRQNILGGRWSRSAVGIAVADDDKYYFTQVFILR